MAVSSTRRRRRTAAALVVVTVLLTTTVACGSEKGSDSGGTTTRNGSVTRDGSTDGDGSTGADAPTTTTTPPPQLPGGGRKIFPDRRVVAYYGNSQSAALGVLGETGPNEAVPRLKAAAAPFEQPDRPVLGAFELIVSVVQGSPGPDGNFTAPTPPDQIQAWLDAARANGLLLLLDVQPGRANFVNEVKQYESFLREPDVGLALDPEWRMGPNEIPGKTIGHVGVNEVNEVSDWLAKIVAENDLPEKLFVIHQFTESMIVNRPALAARPGLATVVHIDGFGGRAAKLSKYDQLRPPTPFYVGFKLFYDEDTDVFSPADVLAFAHPPDLITYQ